MPDLDGICVRKEIVGGRLVLVPGDEHAAEAIAKLPDKKDAIVRFSTPRNPDHHKFFFKYLSRVLDQTDNIWHDVDEILEAVKFATGHTSRFRRITNPHAQDLELATEIGKTALYYVNNNGDVVPMAAPKVVKIIMALRRGADEYVTRTKSIAFESMGEEKFRAFHNKVEMALDAFLGWPTGQLMEKKNEGS